MYVKIAYISTETKKPIHYRSEWVKDFLLLLCYITIKLIYSIQEYNLWKSQLVENLL